MVLYKAFALPLRLQILAARRGFAGCSASASGMLTLRLRGIFFSIATIAVAIMLETVCINWRYVGGATGLPILRPPETPLFAVYIEMLFVVMAVIARGRGRRWRATSRRSWIGRGLRAIRDNEEAAECSGVPTLKLKLVGRDALGRADGRGGRAVCRMYLSLHRAGLDLQPELRDQRAGDADHRRHGALDRAGDRRGAARLAAAGRHRDHLVAR